MFACSSSCVRAVTRSSSVALSLYQRLLCALDAQEVAANQELRADGDRYSERATQRNGDEREGTAAGRVVVADLEQRSFSLH